ncbi:MAG: ammonium transporter [Cyanothece sp. SIO1E1]|nr:ammonium transporter [Cyanothece sp. SIO1E1]
MLDLNVAWVIGCAGLVFLMQPGFMCLESGLSRSKNSINVAVKNLADIGTSTVLFWVFGYALMFGTSVKGWIGSTDFLLELESDSKLAAFFVFQLMFCGTATTIVSGALAERLKFIAYLIIALLISGLVYPVFGHWAWNGANTDVAAGWLGQLGFVDFAGSTVVHSVGGWVALAALLVVGPRAGRFTAEGRSHKIHGSNLSFSVLGGMLLWVGWLGFNGGSTFALNDQVPGIIAHTIIAGATGMIAATGLWWWRYHLPEVEILISGSISGLVSITACCHAVTTPEAALIGAIGGLIAVIAIHWLERFHIDDGVNAVALHGVVGAWGTLAVALFGDPELLQTGLSRNAQILVQLLGIGSCFVWAFGLTYLLVSTINRICPLRVSAAEEDIGLNVSEHKAKTEIYQLFQIMDQQAQTQDFSLRVPEEPFTEVGKISHCYNQVMTSLETKAHQLKDSNATLQKTLVERTAEVMERRQAEEEIRQKNDQLANALQKLQVTQEELIHSEKMAALGQLVAGVAHEVNTPLGAIRSSVGNISKFLNQTLEHLPDLFATLSPAETQIFLNLLKRSLQNQPTLSAKEERKFKRSLIRQLEVAAIKQAETTADTLVDMGIYNEIESFLPLLRRPDSVQVLNIAYKLSGLQRGTQTIDMATDRASKVVFALKNYARYDSSGEMVLANLIESIETVLTLYQNQFKKGVEIIRNYVELPSIFCYPDQLNQVWTNLIHNAIQAMDNQGTLTIDVASTAQQANISITDSGKGIPSGIQPKIFEPFFTTKPFGEGSGLGLDIVKKIIDKHEGQIEVSSVPGRTTFTVFLPIRTQQPLRT